MKRLKNSIGILSIGILALIFLMGYEFECLSKTIFNVQCPGCGLTRSFREIINFILLNSFGYNILGLPIFIFLVLSFFLLIIDFIKNNNNYISLLKKIINKYYYILIILLSLSWIINIIRNI